MYEIYKAVKVTILFVTRTMIGTRAAKLQLFAEEAGPFVMSQLFLSLSIGLG